MQNNKTLQRLLPDAAPAAAEELLTDISGSISSISDLTYVLDLRDLFQFRARSDLNRTPLALQVSQSDT